GIKSEDINAKKVIFELKDGSKLVIENPNVSAIEMQGQKTYTVSGVEKMEAGTPGIPEEDIAMVAEQAKVSKEKARKAIEETEGDIAAAIEKLKK
ncbi:MAG TPA: nascent polypeptide-associated complex protein, partial [archaeon]|nr:nascent polypeptide-associated complex protein [archaeon]